MPLYFSSQPHPCFPVILVLSSVFVTSFLATTIFHSRHFYPPSLPPSSISFCLQLHIFIDVAPHQAPQSNLRRTLLDLHRPDLEDDEDGEGSVG
ncbi:unnamed protein product [Cuscuta campestris]|uniref:Uncharacterized protein n=1 Tax=Cuscuta campestris TaxID=132261 RepID=A0A484L261_9ASTE|nr:unnamed protein product [Cuscuta campestris]